MSNNGSTRVVDLGEVLLVHDDKDSGPDLWLSPLPGTVATPRLIEAFMRGEVTKGGLAEAGWQCIGKLKSNSQ
jgi:hypothetical protein